MSWIMYSQDIEDGAMLLDEESLLDRMKMLCSPEDILSLNSIMIEFHDKSFLRFERRG